MTDRWTARRTDVVELSRRCAAELADTVAQASRVLARDLGGARDLAGVAAASLAGAAEANARICYGLASVLREVLDECDPGPAADDDELAAMARIVAARLPPDA